MCSAAGANLGRAAPSKCSAETAAAAASRVSRTRGGACTSAALRSIRVASLRIIIVHGVAIGQQQSTIPAVLGSLHVAPRAVAVLLQQYHRCPIICGRHGCRGTGTSGWVDTRLAVWPGSLDRAAGRVFDTCSQRASLGAGALSVAITGYRRLNRNAPPCSGLGTHGEDEGKFGILLVRVIFIAPPAARLPPDLFNCHRCGAARRLASLFCFVDDNDGAAANDAKKRFARVSICTDATQR
jgi:hypothetical protein